MAKRLDKAIISGWIDNRIVGVTRGAIEVFGYSKPLRICLQGNCWRDLAGARLDFRNPEPMPQPELLDEDVMLFQRGVVGDMTASKKIKISAISDSEEEFLQSELDGRKVPYRWHNVLYLEWYSFVSGRVLIEVDGFNMKVSQREWTLDKQAEIAQRVENDEMYDGFCELIEGLDEQGGHWFQLNSKKQKKSAYESFLERQAKVQDRLEKAANHLGSNHEYGLEADGGRQELIRSLLMLKHDVAELLGNSFLDSGPKGVLAASLEYMVDAVGEILPEEYGEMEAERRVEFLKRVELTCDEVIASCHALSLEDYAYGDLVARFEHFQKGVKQVRGEWESEEEL